MTFYQEYSSWWSPPSTQISEPPTIGSKAPSTTQIPFPAKDGRPTIITFLRHCGCPFAEDTFLSLRALAAQNPSIHCVAVSHSSDASTEKWLKSVGGAGDINPITIIVDEKREVYAKWGLGSSGWMHVLSPASLASVYKLGKSKNIWNRPTESGSRWQQAGTWGVDGTGVVRWGGPAQRADDTADFDEAVKVVQGEEKAKL